MVEIKGGIFFIIFPKYFFVSYFLPLLMNWWKERDKSILGVRWSKTDIFSEMCIVETIRLIFSEFSKIIYFVT